MADVVLLDVSDRIATITINRPEARNALNSEVRRRLPAAVTEADGRDDVDVMILTGTDPAFTAGIDLKELAAGGQPSSGGAGGSGDARADREPPVDEEYLRRGPLPAHTKPLIGAINGVAVTGGFEVALACDVLVASDRARFADTHARVGIMPGWGLTVLLAQAVGVRRARELSATGNYLDAETALAWGLVDQC
jgi:enoyl-CoA hydratase/carnithine racemase